MIIPIIYRGFTTIQTVVGLGISEPSTVVDKSMVLVIQTPPSKESIDANADGNVTFWEFARAVADGPAAHTLQNFVTRFRGLALKKWKKQPSEMWDWM